MNRVVVAIVLALLAVSCGGEIDPGLDRPQASEPAEGSVVAFLTIEDTTFELYDEGGGCLAARTSFPGIQETVERRCFGGAQVIAETSACGWLVGPEIEAMSVVANRAPAECDVILPTAFFGMVVEPDIGWVCVGTIIDGRVADGDSQVRGARFLETDPAGYVLDAVGPDEAAAAHLFTATGLRYGQPPLDAPSEPIYSFCEEQAPWGSDSQLGYIANLVVTIDDDLQSDDLILGFEGGTGPEAVSGGAFIDEDFVDMGVTVPASSRALTVWAQDDDGERFFEARYPWPDEFVEVLMSGEDCVFSNTMEVNVSSDFVGGDPNALALTWSSTDCPPASGT